MHIKPRIGGAAMLTKITVAAFSLAVVWLVMTPAAYADDWDKATRFTVNQPIEIPGMILPAGTYIVKIVDLAAERHVVRFLSEDGLTIYATLIGIPNFRLEPTEKSAFIFYEADVNEPRALHAWFYPGHQYGIEFAYPERRAAQIARVVEEPVIAFKEPELFFREEPTPVPVEELAGEPLVAVTPAGKELGLPEFTPVEEPELGPEFYEPLQLPRTATPFPLVALVGLLAAGAASTIRFFHK
jgi:hypothetical protein